MSRQRLAATRLLMQLLEAEGDLVSLPSGGEYREVLDLLILEGLIRAAVRREWLRCPECHEQEARVQTEMAKRHIFISHTQMKRMVRISA